MKTLALAGLALTVLYSLFLAQTLLTNYQDAFYSPDEGSLYLARNLILTVCTFLGIICQHIYRNLNKRTAMRVNIRQVLRSVTREKTFWISILICPLVLIVVFQAAAEIPNNLIAYLLAYQNGFFFESIINLGEGGKSE